MRFLKEWAESLKRLDPYRNADFRHTRSFVLAEKLGYRSTYHGTNYRELPDQIQALLNAHGLAADRFIRRFGPQFYHVYKSPGVVYFLQLYGEHQRPIMDVCLKHGIPALAVFRKLWKEPDSDGKWGPVFAKLIQTHGKSVISIVDKSGVHGIRALQKHGALAIPVLSRDPDGAESLALLEPGLLQIPRDD